MARDTQEEDMTTSRGLHHVTAIAGDPQQNVDFYAGVLGLRLVKKTVNFDDPHTYHLYYGDEAGTPGSILTFFPWPGAPRGRAGVGQIAVISLAIPPSSVGFWLERFVAFGVDHDAPARRFGDTVIAFKDRDGLQLELVATESRGTHRAWSGGGLPLDHGIRGVHTVTLWEHSLERTEEVLASVFGLRPADSEGATTRFVTAEPGATPVVEIRVVGGFLAPIGGVGTVHHVAFRAAQDDDELAMRERVAASGLHATPVIDRQYFHSVYFREPGGVLFEIATDPPGFAIDEAPERLGSALMLPPQYEPRRAEIERVLPPLHAPLAATASLTEGAP
jgi:catechol 2,3-dioxygenase-like lactoylglutathione lyase family enzyme